MWCLGSWTIYIVSVSDEIRPAVASYFWQPEPTVNLTVWWVHNHADPLHLTHWQASWSCQSLTPCSDTESSDFHARKQIRVLLKEKKKWWAVLSLNAHPCSNFKALFQNFVCCLWGEKSILRHQRLLSEAKTPSFGQIPIMHCKKLSGESHPKWWMITNRCTCHVNNLVRDADRYSWLYIAYFMYDLGVVNKTKLDHVPRKYFTVTARFGTKSAVH